MKNSKMFLRCRFLVAICLAAVLTFVGAAGARAQEAQGEYITQASARLIKLVDASNKEKFLLRDNLFSIGGGWLKQSQSDFVPLFTVPLTAGVDYRFLAAGDNDAMDVDLQVVGPDGNIVAKDEDANPEAIVNFRPTASGVHTVRLRLYASRNNLPCMCLGVVMIRK